MNEEQNMNSVAEENESEQKTDSMGDAPAYENEISYLKGERERLLREKVRNALYGELLEISKLDGNIKSFEDVKNHPLREKITEYVNRGLTLSEAFRLISPEKRRSGADSEKKSPGLDHLKATKSSSSGLAYVSPDMMKAYRQLSPDLSDAEIRAHYSLYKKSLVR